MTASKITKDQSKNQRKLRKIRRPKTAWIFFSSERRTELLKQDPTLKFADISKILSPEWKQIKDKSKYVQMWVQDKKRYQNEIESLSPDEKKMYILKHGKRYLRKNTNAPKLPLGPYMFFVKETHCVLRKKYPLDNFNQIGSKLGKLWREMKEGEKSKFKNQSLVDRSRYKQEIQQKIMCAPKI